MADTKFKRGRFRYGSGDELIIQGDLTVEGTLVSNALEASDTPSVDTIETSGDATIGNDLDVAGDATVVGAITASGAITGGSLVTSGTAALGATTITGAASVSTDLTVSDDLIVTDDASVGGDLAVTGLATVGSTFAVTSTTALGGNCTITNATDPKLTVTDSTTPCSAVVQALNTTVKLGSSTNHSVLMVVNDTTVATHAASSSSFNGVISKLSAAGSSVNRKVATVSHTCDSGTNTETLTALIPAGVSVLFVVARVTTILAGAGLTTWKLGDAGDDDRYGATLALAANTTVLHTNYTAAPAGTWSASARDIVLKAAAGQFDSGVVRVEVHYEDSTAPTS